MERLDGEKLIVIDGAIHHIKDYKDGRKKGYKKGVAYTFDSIDFILPFRGDMEDRLNNYYDGQGVLDNAGIYKYGQQYVTILPTVRCRDKYMPDKILDPSINLVFDSGLNVPINIHAEGETFKPHIGPNNDLTMKAFKAAVSLKESPEDAYDERIYHAPIGTVASSRKSNFRKSIFNNEALAATKFVQYCETFDLDVAIVLKDKKNCPFPMKTNGKPLVIFADDEFDISNAVNVREMQNKLNIDK
jgi:hypothetical protein